MRSLTLFLGLLGLCLLLVGVQALKVSLLSRRTDYSTKAFELIRNESNFKALFLGDSTAVGVGSDPTTSTAGWFSQEFPQASVENISESGLWLAGLRKKLNLINAKHYDLIVIQIGANDIMRLTPLTSIDKDIRFILKSLGSKSEQIIFLHSGDIGAAPIFTWPFTWILSKRSYQVRAIYQKAAKDTKTFYVDLIDLKSDKIFRSNPGKYYARDGLHLTGQGYRVWYEAIRRTLKTKNMYQHI
ncbi:MAG: hypothetical protein HY209_04910 [Candidatus Omnitrophica bacterium]|nr:hypothetical protein [Candidatus Omnitrophota bacterium]